MTVYRPKGRRHYRYDFEVDGRRYSGATGETTKTKAREMEAAERRKVVDKAAGRLSDDITLWDAVELVMGNPTFSAGYRDSISCRSRRFLGEVKGAEGLSPDILVGDISSAHVARLVHARQREGLEPGTIRNELAVLQKVLTVAADAGYRVPVINWKLKPKAQRRTRYLTSDEEARLLEALRPGNRIAGTPWETAPASVPAEVARAWQDVHDLVMLMLDTGLRHGEAVALRWDNVWIDRRQMEVRRWKTKKTDVVSLTRRCVEMLDRRVAAKRRAGEPYVFSGHDAGEHRTYSLKGLAKVMERLGLNSPDRVAAGGKATPHTMRHTFAVKLARSGEVTLHDLRALMSHASISETERYSAWVTTPAADRAAEVLDRLHADQTTPS